MKLDQLDELLKNKKFFTHIVRKMLETKLELYTLAYRYYDGNYWADAFIKLDGTVFYARLRILESTFILELYKGKYEVKIEKTPKEVLGEELEL